MTRQEHLLIRAMEECAEVAQRISKALVFGLDEVQPGQPLTNRDRVVAEYTDLVAVMEMAGFPLAVVNGRRVDEKIAKVEKYLRYSEQCGTLQGEAGR